MPADQAGGGRCNYWLMVRAHRAALHQRFYLVFAFTSVITMFFGAVCAAEQTEKIDPGAAKRLAAAWKEFFNHHYDMSIEKVDGLAKSEQAAARWHAMHCQARSYLASGDRRSLLEARKLWTSIGSGAASDPYHAARALMGKALLLVHQNRDKQAETVIRRILSKNLLSVVTIEARLELAFLFSRQGKGKEASEQLNAALAMIENGQSVGIHDSLQRVFTDAVRHARDLLTSPGGIEFEKAMATLRAGKYQPALVLFKAIVKSYPDSEYARRSQVQIGYCHLDLGRSSVAIKHWQDFIAGAPSQAWRGQAYVGLIDAFLEYEMDLAQAEPVVKMATDSLAKGLKDKKASVSWKMVEYDLRLRQAVTLLLRGDKGQAVGVLESASKIKGLARNRRHGSRMLSQWAAGVRPVAPPEINPIDQGPTLVMGLLACYAKAQESEHAKALLDRLLTDKCGRLSQPIYAYAYFQQAVLYEANGEREEAKSLYQRSRLVFPKASWHDITLYRLALMTQAEVDSKYKDVVAKLNAAGPDEEVPVQKELAVYHQALREILGYWSAIAQEYPDSEYLEPALRLSGELYVQIGDWENASEMWHRYTGMFPKSAWAGSVFVGLIDLQLEHLYDLPLALKTAHTAMQWVRVGDKQLESLPDITPPDRRLLKQHRYGVCLRAAIVAYLDQKYEKSIRLFDAAKPYADKKKDFKVVKGQFPGSLEKVQGAARAQRKLTPQVVLEGSPKVKLILQLADIYLESSEWLKVIELCDVVIEAKDFMPTPFQKSWAHHQRATAIYGIPECKNAREDYRLAQKTCPNAPWAAKAMFHAACITNNFYQEKIQAAEEYKKVVNTYPKSEIADKAAYFIGVSYEWAKEWPKAKLAYNHFLSKYPNSRWVKLVQKHHLPNVEKQLKGNQ